MKLRRIGAFGPSESGKSTLAHVLSKQYWQRYKIRSLVLDPHLEDWGEQAWVTADETKFWPAAWKTTGSLIIVEDTSATIQRDKDIIPVFTKMRHNLHHLMVIGHSGTDLLPVMRHQLNTIYLFKQPISSAKIWAEEFAEERLLQAVTLKQYEFIHYESYGEPKRMILKI